MLTVFGSIDNPLRQLAPGASSLYTDNAGSGAGLIILGNNLIKLIIVVAGIYALLNIIIAGYGFLSSTEPKEIAKHWGKIWQAMLGLLIIAGSFVLAAIFGWIIFKDPTILLVPRFYGP